MAGWLRQAVASAVLLGAAAAWAQAPSEERRPASNPLSDAQQRAEFARQSGAQAGNRVRQSELTLQQIEQEMQAAQKELEAIRARQAKTRKELEAARAEQAAALKSLEREAAELERLRRSQK